MKITSKKAINIVIGTKRKLEDEKKIYSGHGKRRQRHWNGEYLCGVELSLLLDDDGP